MGRKRRSTHKPKRTQATQSCGKKNHHTKQRIPFIHLPLEIRDAIVEDLRIHDLAILIRTSKPVKAYLERRLYQKIYTKIDTPHNTAGLVELLQRRTHIASMIRELVLDEYHPRHTRRLLSIEMLNLWSLLVQHEGDTTEYVSEREKRALNKSMVEQSAISNFVVWTRAPLTLSKQDACLFRQSNIDRLRFSYIDFSPFESASHRYLGYSGLKTLFIEESTYSTDALKRLITPSRSLTSIALHQLRGPPPFEERHLCSVLSHAAGTLKVLKLFWTYHPRERDYGFDLSQFTGLRLLRIEPGLLLGPHKSMETYTSAESPDLPQLIRSRLPPNLKVLLLESVTAPARIVPDMEQVILGKDLEFMRCLLEQRDSVAPKLTRLFMYYYENMVTPNDLFELANRVGIYYAGLYGSDEVEPDWDWLDKDEDSFINPSAST